MVDTMKIGYEIDFLQVGNGEKSGDAIAVRYGYSGNYKILVYDGGTKESGSKLVEHIKKYYETDYVDFVVNSHPDGDHASGLTEILENLEVGELWIHRPWEHSAEIRELFKDGRITDNSLSERLKEGLNNAYKLEEIAKEKQITIKEPYQGEKIGIFQVLSPSKEWYLELVPEFRKSPEAKKEASIMTEMARLAKAAIEYLMEKWDVETLGEDGETSAENESSVILYGNIEGKGILLTGDGGKQSLIYAMDYCDTIGIDLSNLKFVQVPHHGSRRNVSPSVLNRLIGEIKEENSSPQITAYVSASKESKTHPRKVTTNAFIRRGAKVFTTKDNGKHHFNNMPDREDWSVATPIEFSEKVEA